MIARLFLSERAEIMREFRDKVIDLHEEFWDILTGKFAPIDARNYTAVLSADDKANGTLPYDDKDAPLLMKVMQMLDAAYDMLEKRCWELEKEEDAQTEAQRMFYAWDIGLCPYAMREYRRKLTPYAWNSRNWDEIAKFLKGDGMSRADTDNAVREYLKDKDPDGDTVLAIRKECGLS